MIKRLLGWSVFYLLFLTQAVFSGEVSPRLAEKLSLASSGEFVSVWIKLHSVENSAVFKASVNAAASTRAGRYQNAVSRLRSNHTNAQTDLLQYLENWQVSGYVRNLKSHWLVNIVEAEIRSDRLGQLATRSDIEIINAVPQIVSIDPEESDKEITSPSSAATEDHLVYINADQAWADGYTGAGRVVCSFDTGVKGDHPALMHSWKGNDGDSTAAWFDPLDQESFPHQVGTNHGTKSMGLMVGRDDLTGDTVGVAPDAKWISAGILDISGTSLIDAFEWAADPDGNPNTVSDLPDVINHSWGVTDIGCENIFYDLIDASEALGIVNIFSAGNEGTQGSETIRNPANRANTNIDCFAVGNIIHDQGNPPIMASSSSRGPSDCNGAIKPNVTAPGTNLRTTTTGGAPYANFTGTSAAAPVVSGLVALMRQKNPNATVDEIKTAILNNTQTFGLSLPDNDYGWGVIDCMAALNALSSTNSVPNVRLYEFDHGPVSAGGTAAGLISLQNLGATVTNVNVSITNLNSALTIVDGTAAVGTLTEGAIVASTDSIIIAVADTVSEGSRLKLELTITGNSYNKVTSIYVVVGEIQARSMFTHTAGNAIFTISNYGTYGLGPGSFYPAGGVGFDFGAANDLYECGLMIATASDKVSDGVRNSISEPDGDFKIMPGGNLSVTSGGSIPGEMTQSIYSDERATSPIEIEIEQTTYSYNNLINNDFVIMQYIIKNRSQSPITGMYVGLYFDWDVIDWQSNSGGYMSNIQTIWTAHNDGSFYSQFRGAKLLNGTISSGFTQTAAAIQYPDFGGDGFTELEKYNALKAGIGSATTYDDVQLDLNQIIGAGPISLSVGGVDTVAFAILAGSDQGNFITAASFAEQAYNGIVTSVEEIETNNTLPSQFALHQNFPNPFNPITDISFDLPVASDYELTIYNILGREVDRYQGRSSAGTVRLKWDALNYSSGVYFYNLTAGDFSDSKKMLLLK